MREMPGRRMFPPENVPAVPLMYGVRAEKNGVRAGQRLPADP